VKIGSYELFSIETGRFALDGGAMFGVVPKNLWQRNNPSDEYNRIPLALRSLLIKSANRKILIDTGIGNKYDEKHSNIFKIDFSTYSLEKSLDEIHLSPDDITDVIITHFHFDHAGGTTYRDSGQVFLTFPNAMHHIQKEQWDWALQPSQKDKASFLNEDFLLLEEKKQLNKLNGPMEIFSGIELFVMYGHTPGMQVVKIYNSQSCLLYCTDLIPTVSHIPIPWVMAYDNNPLVTIEEKNRIISEAVKEEWILFFEHDPLCEAATVIQTDKGFKKGREISINSN
jgi:glyoxylase-like metal-dependent hydrolase (beta-lactamase superfamily II)